jgi:hypothetical protein
MSGNSNRLLLGLSGIALPGVNVIVEGANRGTQTNFDGQGWQKREDSRF